MIACKNCKNVYDESAKSCPRCGAPRLVSQFDMGPAKDIFNTPDSTGDYDQHDVSSNRMMACLCYLPFLVFIPIFKARTSKFVRFHINQGLALLLVETVCAIIVGLIRSIHVPILSWFTGFLASIVWLVLGFVFLILMLFGIICALAGKAKQLPIIGWIKLGFKN